MERALRRSSLFIVGLTLMAMLAWAPLPLGSNRPWAWSLLGVMSGAMLLMTSVIHLTAPRPARVSPLVAAAGSIWLLIAALVLLQQYPGTPAVLHHPIWSLAAGYGLEPVSRIGMNASDIAEWSMRCLTLGAVFWIAYGLGKDSGWASTITLGIIAIISAYALFGLVLFFGDLEIAFFAHPANTDRFRSTFVNPNNYATFANLGLLLVLALVAEPFVKPSGVPWRLQFIEALQNLLARRPWLMGVAVLLAGTSLLSASRGGAFSLVVTLLAMLFLLFLKTKPGRMRIALVSVLALAGIAGTVLLSGEVLIERLGQLDEQFDEDGAQRLQAWTVSMQLVAQEPWLGHGLGSFQDAFNLVRDQRFYKIFDKAHSSYVELAVELGLPATVLIVLSFLLLFILVWRGSLQRRRDMVYPLAATAATVLVASHAVTEFSMQIPAVGITYAAILGVGCAQATSSARKRRARATQGSSSLEAGPGVSKRRRERREPAAPDGAEPATTA